MSNKSNDQYECQHLNNEVKDSRPTTFNGYNATRRRRRCMTCKVSFSTLEIAIEDARRLETFMSKSQGIVNRMEDYVKYLKVDIVSLGD